MNIWNIERVDVIVSPETLSNTFFQQLLDEKEFHTLSYALLADEIYVWNTSGLTFRPQFKWMGWARGRFPKDIVFVGLTATMRRGEQLVMKKGEELIDLSQILGSLSDLGFFGGSLRNCTRRSVFIMGVTKMP